MHTPVLKSIYCLLSSSIKTQMPAAISTNTIKIRNNIPASNARKPRCVHVHTGGSVRIWLVGKKSKLIQHNITFWKPVHLFIRTCLVSGQRWQLGQSLQQCPSRDSRISWGAYVSAGINTSGIRTGFPKFLSLLSTWGSFALLRVLPGGCVFTQMGSLP